ncbi:MAG: hypothetical protein ACYC4B_26985, partial [Pirellulaceae bacterium]
SVKSCYGPSEINVPNPSFVPVGLTNVTLRPFLYGHSMNFTSSADINSQNDADSSNVMPGRRRQNVTQT